MGGSKSKEVVQHVEKSARNVISKQQRLDKPVDFSGSIADSANQISPEILKEIEKWASVKKNQANPMLSDEAKEWKSKMPTVPSASLIRIEQDKVLDKVWIENKRIEGKLSEEQLISILTRLRDNEDQLTLIETETKISKEKLQMLMKSVRVPRFTQDPDDSSSLRIAT